MTSQINSLTLRVPRLSLAILLALSLAGCTVTTSHRDSKDENGKGKDVDIRTPFGSMSVHEGAMQAKDTGLSAYPGAELKKTPDHDGDSNANVNISSSLFGMKLVVLKYVTKDSPDKVMGFYRKEMGKYGKVVECQESFNMVFSPRDKSNHEVSCDNSKKGDGEYRQELKVGTENNQRIVAIKPVGDGAEFALVYVSARDSDNTM